MTEEDLTYAEETEVVPSISLADLVDIVNLIDLVSQRGAIQGNELETVGALRKKFVDFVNAHNPPEDLFDNEDPNEEVENETY